MRQKQSLIFSASDASGAFSRPGVNNAPFSLLQKDLKNQTKFGQELF